MLALVPDREGPVAVEVLHAVFAVHLVQVQDDFGVRLRREAPPCAGQIGAQLDVVEDFAVEGDPDRSVGVGHRLVAGGQIDDAEPRMGQAGGSVLGYVDPGGIRPPMPDRADHPLQRLRIDRLVRPG